jgi:hypothetical protein
MDEFTRNSPVGTKMKLNKDTDVLKLPATDVLKLPAGVLIRTYKSTGSYDGGVSVHTIYLTDDQYFGAREKKA